jgi:hypothetical protein
MRLVIPTGGLACSKTGPCDKENTTEATSKPILTKNQLILRDMKKPFCLKYQEGLRHAFDRQINRPAC